MSLSLYVLRYALFLVPGTVTIYISESIPSEANYVLLLLLYLLFIQQRDHRWDAHLLSYAIAPLLLVELAGLTGLVYYFDGLLSVAYLSLLIPVSRSPSGFLPQTLLIGAVMNIAAYFQLPWLMLVMLNLAFLSIVLLLYRYKVTFDDKRKIESLYDQLKVKHYDLEATEKTVVDYAKKVQELAQIEERNRIAHDLHDDLGHKLIRLKMMLEAASRLGPTEQAKVMEIVSEVRDQLGESMESLRTTVRRIKPAHVLVSRYSLETLIGEFANESGISIQYELEGQPYPLYPSDEFILYRNAQEAVTNAIRHGHATHVMVKLHYGQERLRMVVGNNGTLPDAAKLLKGLGLMGMEDRVKVIGGSVEIVTEPQFEIITVLPRRGVAG